MNKAAQLYWEDYWGEQETPQLVTAWQFGASPDKLAQLVIEGTKTATCSAHMLYELENEPIPSINEYSILLSSIDEPVAMIKTTEVTVVPMNEVTEDFARAEGEGDRSYTYWWNVHEEFFKNELSAIGKEFSEDMLLVCERFELIDVKK
ncbi:ASCH domain-containing protein [Sporosarcina aquimarina]|uniref:ASCH domain-containing protein n=1 Tax=Sporosarcina aquimarina TaxID=114975 RepID=A0ABU4G056_9BACL|nr:ASCH domain-containing protein [Sporosarcina aquimarina]MDW0109688.1 ASCH domain-containing protein [Sporosarcina aquimarina]